jgi:uncharacterized protein with FMN-binding domain
MQKARKRLLRNALIMLAITFVMGIVLTLYVRATFTVPDASGQSSTLIDGTYSATEKGCLSDVTFTMTVTGGRVSAVDIDASGETPALGGAAAETLAEAILAANGIDGVDAVSGSTYTSSAVLTAAETCLEQARG